MEMELSPAAKFGSWWGPARRGVLTSGRGSEYHAAIAVQSQAICQVLCLMVAGQGAKVWGGCAPRPGVGPAGILSGIRLHQPGQVYNTNYVPGLVLAPENDVKSW